MQTPVPFHLSYRSGCAHKPGLKASGALTGRVASGALMADGDYEAVSSEAVPTELRQVPLLLS